MQQKSTKLCALKAINLIKLSTINHQLVSY